MQITGEVVVATLALILSAIVASFQIRDRRQAKFNLENTYIDSLLLWHRDVVTILIDLRDVSIETKLRGEKRRLLSTLIEQGRFFFPNIDRGDDYGRENPLAYRGYRHLALDFLVSAFELSRNTEVPKFEESMIALQRHFTSMVFSVIKPSEHFERLRSMTDRINVKKESYEQFFSHKDANLLCHIWRATYK